ncbi:MAG: GIY-YIG nuclease family protein [bacterium]
MKYSVYALNNGNSKIYIGYTSDLEKRIKRHNQELPNKKTSFTSKNGGHWLLFYKEEFDIKEEAIKREKELKSYQGRKFLKSLSAYNSVGRSASWRTLS